MNTTERNQWTTDDLQKIGEADDLKIAPFREDGATYGTPTWIWNVAVDGELYVRAYTGQQSRWYQAALRQKAGRIHAAGLIRDVAFVVVDDATLNNRIDAAYRTKYAGSPYLAAVINGRAKSATVRILPSR